jgi:ATP-dependent 26S proteasome regulatory subunit
MGALNLLEVLPDLISPSY